MSGLCEAISCPIMDCKHSMKPPYPRNPSMVYSNPFKSYTVTMICLDSRVSLGPILIFLQDVEPSVENSVTLDITKPWKGSSNPGRTVGQVTISILYYTILYYTILYYTILYYTILYYTILYYTILYYTILYYTILYPSFN